MLKKYFFLGDINKTPKRAQVLTELIPDLLASLSLPEEKQRSRLQSMQGMRAKDLCRKSIRAFNGHPLRNVLTTPEKELAFLLGQRYGLKRTEGGYQLDFNNTKTTISLDQGTLTHGYQWEQESETHLRQEEQSGTLTSLIAIIEAARETKLDENSTITAIKTSQPQLTLLPMFSRCYTDFTGMIENHGQKFEISVNMDSIGHGLKISYTIRYK